MIVLDDLRKKSEHVLPHSKAKIWLFDYALAGDMLGSLDIDIATGQPKNNIDPLNIVVSIIAEWEFCDRENNPLEINKENVGKLSMVDFAYLSEQIQQITSGLTPEVKKNI
jgi:hypothetical protein